MTSPPPPKPAAIIRAYQHKFDRHNGMTRARVQILRCTGRTCVVRTCARWVDAIVIDGHTHPIRTREWWYETDTVTSTGKVSVGGTMRISGTCY